MPVSIVSIASTETAEVKATELADDAHEAAVVKAGNAGERPVGRPFVSMRNTGTAKVGGKTIDLAEKDLVLREYTWNTEQIEAVA